MIQRIETMVKGMGEMSLEAIYTWFPKRDKEELKGDILGSPNLIIEGNMVKYKKDLKPKSEPVKIFEKDIDVALKTTTILKEQVEEPVKVVETVSQSVSNNSSKNITFNKLIETINKHNKDTNLKLEELNSGNYDNKSKAIKKYYDERFTLEENAAIKGKGYEFITLKHKQKGVEVAYLLIADVVKKNIIDEIYGNHKFDTVYFCQLDEESPKMDLPLGEYFYRNCSDLITNYMSKYKIVKRNIEVYDIVEE